MFNQTIQNSNHRCRTHTVTIVTDSTFWSIWSIFSIWHCFVNIPCTFCDCTRPTCLRKETFSHCFPFILSQQVFIRSSHSGMQITLIASCRSTVGDSLSKSTKCINYLMKIIWNWINITIILTVFRWSCHSNSSSVHSTQASRLQ